MTSYKCSPNKCCTNVYEYWNGVHMKTYLVYETYKGGNIEKFLDENAKCLLWFNYDNQLSLF